MTIAPAAKPQPTRDNWNAPFWDACAEGRFILPFCPQSGRYFFPPAPVSPYTGRPGWEWRAAGGGGVLWSHVTFHQNYFPGFAAEIPYPVLMVQLDEGPFLLGNLRGAAEVSDLWIGQRMRVIFDAGPLPLPQFAPEAQA